MPAYTFSISGESRTTVVELVSEPSAQEWSQIMDQLQLKAGSSNFWDLDLRTLEFMGSNSLGMIVSLNAALSARGGSLRLLMAKGSRIATLIQLTKLDRIISVVNL